MNEEMKPRLRYVDVIPIEVEGERIVVLRDPHELSGGEVAIPLPAFMIMSLFDGTRTLRDVQVEIQRQFNQILPVDQIEALVGNLDEQYLLDNDRARDRLADLEREFCELDLRPAAHAGSAYPAEKDELIEEFDKFFASFESEPNGNGVLRGLVTPHIDIRQGGACMARAFDLLRGENPPELYIILGVAHNPAPNLYTLTDKDFDTPLGPARADKAAAARLRELVGADKLDGEYAHKLEHSVEFQTVFLKYIHRDDHDFTILPILCGSIDDGLAESGEAPILIPEVRDFCAALKTLIEETDRRVCVIAGVDLSHVGRKFGDEQGIDDLRADLVRTADLRMLGHVEEGDAEAFFDHFRPDQNARNVDAVSAVYSMLNVIGPGKGELLHYDQYRENETDSMVTYASVALY